MHERTVGKLLAELGYVRLSTRPQHPASDPAAQETFKKLAHQEIEWVILGRQIAGSMHVRILSRRYS
jgi:hypothetical protein